VLERAKQVADWAGFAGRKAEAAKRGKRLGRGMAYYVEIAGGGGTEEHADVRVAADGTIEMSVGTQSNGQGHETVYAQVAAAKLGVPMDQIRIVQGDTTRMEVGGGTGGSRSMAFGGGAVLVCADDMIARGTALASEDLGSDVDYSDGLFKARGSNATLSWAELASRHPGALDGRSRYTTKESKPAPTFPNGCHIAEVELDPDTGMIAVTRYSLVDDFGVLVNPMLVEGQIHGGIAQGLGQAVLENIVYDEAGQLITGSLMDYGIPRADVMPPAVAFETLNTPSPTNPLGVKGCGEAGTWKCRPRRRNCGGWRRVCQRPRDTPERRKAAVPARVDGLPLVDRPGVTPRRMGGRRRMQSGRQPTPETGKSGDHGHEDGPNHHQQRHRHHLGIGCPA
jgi:carbon-monoxide dehydrogenase large subunit